MTDWGGDTPWDKDEGEGDAVIARTGSREDDKSRAARVPRQRADGDVMCLTSRESRPGRGQGERASPSHIVGRARGAERLSAPLPGRRFKALRLQFSSLGSDESCGTFFRGPPSRAATGVPRLASPDRFGSEVSLSRPRRAHRQAEEGPEDMPEERRRRAARTALRRVADARIGKQIFQSNQLPPVSAPQKERRRDGRDSFYY